MSHIDDIKIAIKRAGDNQWRNDNLEAKRAYQRAYYAKNKEKLRENSKRAYANLPPEIKAARVAYQAQWRKDHPEARKKITKRYREGNKEYLARADREYNANPERRKILRARHAATLESLAGRPRPEICDACGGPPDDKIGMHFDHCHKRGHFRGWICRECNLALGNIRDDIGRLRKLIAYLKRTKDGPASQFSLPGV
jgi:hypothetical protein